MKNKFALVLCGLAALAVAGGIESGLKPGESTPAYDPAHVTGADKGTNTCPVCKYGSTPAAQLWVGANAQQKDVVAVARLMDDAMSAANKGGNIAFKGFVVYSNAGCGESNSCCTTPEQKAQHLKEIASKNKLANVAFTFVKADSNAPALYKINPEAKTTLIVYKDRKVTKTLVDITTEKGKLMAAKEAIDQVLR
jgi:protocatechuate 3,4-dioxygenase beta subunit